MGSISSTGRGKFEGRATHCKVYRLSAMSCAKMADPIETPFGICNRMGPGSQGCTLVLPGEYY